MEVGADRAALALLPADHPEGPDAAVKLVSLKRAENLHHPTVSTFVVDYRPGGSAMLHRRPSPGYVLVYVLSDSIQAEAWSARSTVAIGDSVIFRPRYDLAKSTSS